MGVIKFEVTGRKRKETFTVVRTKSLNPDWTFVIYLDNDTAEVLYPLTIEPVIPGISITLSSDSVSSCSFPPSVPSFMVNRFVESLKLFHEIVNAARERIREEQRQIIGHVRSQ